MNLILWFRNDKGETIMDTITNCTTKSFMKLLQYHNSRGRVLFKVVEREL